MGACVLVLALAHGAHALREWPEWAGDIVGGVDGVRWHAPQCMWFLRVSTATSFSRTPPREVGV